MRDISKKLTVINTGKNETETGTSTQSSQSSIFGVGGVIPGISMTGGLTEDEVQNLIESYVKNRFISKVNDDYTDYNLGIGGALSVADDANIKGSIKVGFNAAANHGEFSESVYVGDFNEGSLGSGAATFMRDGSSYSEVDFLKVRKKATFTNITVQELKHVGGEIILSPAAMVVSKVEELEDGYKCYFEKEDSDGRRVYSYFEVGDQARCQTFNLEENQYYWRLVTEVNEDEGYIVLSMTDCDEGSGVPKEGDNISQLGNRDDASRQAAIILSAYGSDAPSYKQYSGIDSYSLDGKQVTKLSPYGNELTGVLNIEKGSKGWENFEGLPEEIQKAADVSELIENLEYGKNNMLRNSGFTGDYLTAVLNGSTNLKDTSKLYSPSLKHWDATDAEAQESEVSESGKQVFIADGGSLTQTLYFKIINGEKYIFSFRGKGGSVSLSVGGYSHLFTLTEEWAQYVAKFTSSNEGELFSLRVTGDCTLCELQLERGTVKSAWGISPLDNRSELAKYDSLTYLANAMKGETTTLGGLINTGLISMGTFNEDGEMTEITAGMSGVYNESDSVAYFAGGNWEKAVYTVAAYLDNPNYVPTQEELNNMAKFVVTHGGRAILNDIILRGYIYALGGMFKGAVDIANGKILLNADGSGSLADRAVSWDKNGVMYRKAYDVILWQKIQDYADSETYVIDLSKGTYIDLSYVLSTDKFALPNADYDQAPVYLKWNKTGTRRSQCATLEGSFLLRVVDGDYETFQSATLLSLDIENEDILLTYDASQEAWIYRGEGGSIENGLLTIAEPVTEEQTNEGLSDSITISDGTTSHTLTFTSGLLTGYTTEYIGGGN